jgi:hypothetical protein
MILHVSVSAIEFEIKWFFWSVINCRLLCLLENLAEAKCLTQNKSLVMESTRYTITCMISNRNFPLTFLALPHLTSML